MSTDAPQINIATAVIGTIFKFTLNDGSEFIVRVSNPAKGEIVFCTQGLPPQAISVKANADGERIIGGRLSPGGTPTAAVVDIETLDPSYDLELLGIPADDVDSLMHGLGGRSQS